MPQCVAVIANVLSRFRQNTQGMRPSTDKRWIITVTATIGAFFTLLGLFNYLIDPLWCFSHSIGWNNAQLSIDDRQQKTNFITFRKFRYNALILGSSRTTYINQRDFVGMKAFNYSVPSMKPTEYNDFIAYAKEKNGRDFDRIIIGMDFFGTNANIQDSFERAEKYIDTANSFLYRFKILMSIDVLKRSIDNIKQVYRRTGPTYDRKNRRTPKVPTPAEQRAAILEQISRYRNEVYGSRYSYRSDLKKVLQDVKRENFDATFTVFTTPVTKPLFCLVVEERRLDDYERWMRDLVEVFGTVHNFMYLNSVTKNYEMYFLDAMHPYPKTGTLIAHKLIGYPDEDIPQDFGVLVNKSNLDNHLSFIRRGSRTCE